MLAVKALNSCDRGCVGAQYSATQCPKKLLGEVVCHVANHKLSSVAQFNADHARKGRIMVFLAVAKNELHHSRHVVVGHALKHRMARGSGLHQHESASVATAGAPRNLKQKLKSPFVGPKVGAAEHRVRVGYYSQGQAGEV